MRFFSLCLLMCCVLLACKTDPDKAETKGEETTVTEEKTVDPIEIPGGEMNRHPVNGKWKMAKVMNNGADVTNEHNPENERWIMFKGNQTYASDGAPYGPNTGKWFWQNNKNLLFLDSDVGEEDDSYWTVSFDGNEMKWKGAKTEFAKGFEITYSKVEEELQ